MLKNNHFYQEKANQLYKDTVTATKEVKRLLDAIKLEEISLIKSGGSFTSSGVRSHYIIEYGELTYITKSMNNQAFKIFNDLLPLDKHEKMAEPIITKGLLQDVENPDKVFKKF
ncbi:MAG: hypothetical protein M0Q88_05850 [Bacilli bacterium]|nr:hypothetical protein [Bacilli bacterium]